jgi:hypothetical protein
MTPDLAEIVAGSVETLSGIDLNVVTNNSTGCKITVSAGAAGANKIAPGDISLRIAAPGDGVAAGTFAAYTALGTTSTDLWNTTGAALNGTDVELDVKFSNLSAYPAAAGATKITPTPSPSLQSPTPNQVAPCTIETRRRIYSSACF